MSIRKDFNHCTLTLPQNRPKAKGIRRKARREARKLRQNRRNHAFVMSKTSACKKTVCLFLVSSLRDDTTPLKEPPPLAQNRPKAKGVRRKGGGKARRLPQNRRNHAFVMS